MDIFGGAPRVLGYPRPVVARPGADAVLKCQIGGDPRPEVVWERKTVPVVPEGRYRVSNEGKAYVLTISGVTLQDAGQYICKARNSVGETYAAATLKVEEEGEAEAPEADGVRRAAVENGEHGGQQNGVAGRQNGEVVRRSNGEEPGDDVPLSDDRPRFLIRPMSLRVDRGEDAAFSCKLWGTPPPEVVWEKDGKKLGDVFESAHFSATGCQEGGWCQLKVHRTRMPDGGVYTCRAVNRHGEALAGAVLLVQPVPEREDDRETPPSSSNGYSNGHYSGAGAGGVGGRHRGGGRHGPSSRRSEEPPLTKAKAKKFAVSEGKHAKFRCFVTGKPKPEIVWRKDGVPLEAGRRHLVFEDREGYYTLKVMYCKLQDAGLYVCAASNALGNTLSAVHLTVKGPAVRFKRPLRDVEVRERDAAVLECEVPEESIPAAWYLEDKRLQPGGKYAMEQSGTRRRLTIRDTGADDDGVYLCEMPDGGKSIAELAVKGTIVRKLPRKLEVLEGENAAFCVEVEEDDMEVHWFKDGLKLRENQQTILKAFGRIHMLVFVNVAYQDTGTVTFVTGRSKTSSRLKVKAAKHSPPPCPVGVQMGLDSPNAALLSWVPALTSSQMTTRSIYMVERQEVGSQEWQKCLTTDTDTTQVEVTGDSVTCEGDFRFRVCCVNKYGRSGHVEFPKAVHLVPGPKIRSGLRDSEVMEGEDAGFSLELSGPATGTWFLNSTQLKNGERFSVHQMQTQHSLVVHGARISDHAAEVTFIANGVRDSAVLKVQAAVVKFSPMLEADCNKRVETGDAIVLYCEVTHPSATVRWLKDGAELQVTDGLTVQSEGNMRRIVIQSAGAADSGVYTCETMADVIKFNVNVEAAPARFYDVPEGEKRRSLEAGEALVLHCDLSDPSAQVYWYKDGEQIFDQSGIDLLEEGPRRTLVIQSAVSSDSGVYTCQTAEDVAAFQVEVKAPPVRFSAIPEEDLHKSAMELDPVVLHCELSSEDAVAIWYKDDREVQPSENVTLQAEGTMRRLIVRSAEAADAGTYACQAGGSRMVFTVHVKEPPVMIVEPKEDVVLERHLSEEVVLQCELTRSGGQVRWFKEGLLVAEDGNVRLTAEGPYRRLTVRRATAEDSGEYVCDTDGDSVFFQLTVTEPLVRIVSPSEAELELTHVAPGRLELSCEISRADAPVRWFRDGLEVEEGPLLVLEVRGAHRSLLIPMTTVEDSGEYVCDTEDDSVGFLVTITEPPVKLARPDRLSDVVECFSGAPLVLEVEVSRPNAEVVWRRDGREVGESGGGVSVTEDGLFRRLTIHAPATKDSGKYTCDAADDAIDFQVNVLDPPIRILRRSEVKVEHRSLVSDDIVLECELSCPSAIARWFKDGRRLEGDERYCEEEEGAFRSLVILNAELSDSGEYLLDARDDSIHFRVTVEEPPVEILGNSADPDYQEMVAGDDLVLACEVSRANAAVQWYCNERPLSSDQRTYIESHGALRKLVLSDVQPGDSGKYVCDAVDDKMVTVVKVQESPVTFLNKQEGNIVTGYEAESITLMGVVSKERAVVSWLHDWSPVLGERFQTGVDGAQRLLTIEPLRRSDAGDYTCDANTDQMHFNLLVKEMRVRFSRPLQDLTGHSDSMVTLRCEVTRPKADVQWLKDGVEVAASRRFTIRADGVERSLTVHRLTSEDAGEYACESKDDRTACRLRVELPRVVEFLTELHNTTVLEGEDATFKCVVSPEDVDLVWSMDNEPLALGERFQATRNGLCHTLLLRRCQLLDCSRISAAAEGKVSKACLKVQEAQVLFTKKMEPVMAEEFGDATLETEVSLETAEVQWMRGGVVIGAGPRHALGQDGRRRSLTVRGLTLSDRGTYRCETLHDRTQVKLNVEPRKISVRKPLRDTDTLERETASFEVELSHADVEGVWQKDGIRVKPNNQWRVSTNGRVHGLTLSGLTLEDTGTIAFSAEGLRTSARLTVNETPVSLLRKLSDLRLEKGCPATLECEFSRQNVDAKWLKDGVELKAGKSHRIYSMGRKRFCQVLQCCMEDAGTYTCNAGDVTTSCNLEVFERDLELLQELEDLSVQEDQNAVFMCELSMEDVPAEWHKDGHKIRPSSSVKIRTEGTKHFLLMCNVKPEDSGEVRFVAKQIESVAYLEVEELPVSIVRPLRDRTALEKHRVILECTVSTPRAEATWYKGREELVSSDRLELVSDGCCHRLVIHEAAVEDEGSYSVEVGEHTSKARLMVEAQALVMVKDLTDVEVSAPGPAVFQCEVSLAISKPPAWTLNGDALQHGPLVRLEDLGTVHKLTLRETSADMSGTVRFTTGKAKSSARLTVK